MSKKNKKEKEQAFRITQEKEEVISKLLKFSKTRFKKFDEVILRLFNEEDLSAFFSDRRIWKVHDCFQELYSKKNKIEKEILKNVFIYLKKCSSLLSNEDFIQAVFNMVLFRAYWRKDIFNWKPSSNRGDAQVNELAFYLFCQYKVPAFLYKAFYERNKGQYINWFIHIGTGRKIKELINVPIPFTQKMGHYFLQTPSHFSVAEALRWSQVKGLGGDDKLAERIVYSWIGNKNYKDEDFWEAFLRLLINGGMFNLEKLTELIDYVRESKTENRNYSLKGRTLQSLLRQSDEWHKAAVLIKGNQIWNACGLDGYKVEKKEEVIVLQELLGSKLLANEGRAMKHCVGSYVSYCVTGKSAIFSLRKYSFGLLEEIMATIEVNLSLKRVVQAKAKMNAKISDEAKKHLDIWARNQGLFVNPFL